MEHPGFFSSAGPFTLGEIARVAGAEVAVGCDQNLPITGVKALTEAGPSHISFLDNRKYLTQLKETRAAGCLILPVFVDRVPPGTVALVTKTPYRGFALALQHFAWGVPAFVLVKVFTPPFFAREDSRRPMQFALITVALNVVFGVALFFAMRGAGAPGFVGLAIATSLASWANVALLAGTLASRKIYRLGPAAAARNKTLLPLRGSVFGVAVNSTMHDGFRAANISKERLVPALCASSTITKGW